MYIVVDQEITVLQVLAFNDLNTVLTCFSPVSKDKELLMPDDRTKIDLLIATDCISEGQNLQQLLPVIS